MEHLPKVTNCNTNRLRVLIMYLKAKEADKRKFMQRSVARELIPFDL